MLIERWASQKDLRPRGCRAGAAKGGRHRRVSHAGVDLRLRRAMPGEVPQLRISGGGMNEGRANLYSTSCAIHAESTTSSPN